MRTGRSPWSSRPGTSAAPSGGRRRACHHRGHGSRSRAGAGPHAWGTLSVPSSSSAREWKAAAHSGVQERKPGASRRDWIGPGRERTGVPRQLPRGPGRRRGCGQGPPSTSWERVRERRPATLRRRWGLVMRLDRPRRTRAAVPVVPVQPSLRSHRAGGGRSHGVTLGPPRRATRDRAPRRTAQSAMGSLGSRSGQASSLAETTVAGMGQAMPSRGSSRRTPPSAAGA